MNPGQREVFQEEWRTTSFPTIVGVPTLKGTEKASQYSRKEEDKRTHLPRKRKPQPPKGKWGKPYAGWEGGSLKEQNCTLREKGQPAYSTENITRRRGLPIGGGGQCDLPRNGGGSGGKWRRRLTRRKDSKEEGQGSYHLRKPAEKGSN